LRLAPYFDADQREVRTRGITVIFRNTDLAELGFFCGKRPRTAF
jgi:hypothetical protein